MPALGLPELCTVSLGTGQGRLGTGYRALAGLCPEKGRYRREVPRRQDTQGHRPARARAVPCSMGLLHAAHAWGSSSTMELPKRGALRPSPWKRAVGAQRIYRKGQFGRCLQRQACSGKPHHPHPFTDRPARPVATRDVLPHPRHPAGHRRAGLPASSALQQHRGSFPEKGWSCAHTTPLCACTGFGQPLLRRVLLITKPFLAIPAHRVLTRLNVPAFPLLPVQGSPRHG